MPKKEALRRVFGLLADIGVRRTCGRIRAVALIILGAIVLTISANAQVSERLVVLVDLKGAIGLADSQLVERAVTEARERNAALVVVRVDTPGGLVTSTREIVSTILASRVPVAVYVAPSGARAASAGAYIAYAAHVAAMAPGTHLGAATPVQMGVPGLPRAPSTPQGDKQPTDEKPASMERKVTNDAVAYLKSLAQLRGRNAEWAEKAVIDAATLTATEARDKKVVDLVATDLGDLLSRIDGRSVRTASGDMILMTRHAVVIPVEADWKTRLLKVVTNPNVAIFLLAIGFYGIIFEFWSPGLTGPGIVGGICLIIALMALSALPINYGGAALLLLGLALMIAEAFAPGFGILGLGGAAAFAFGAAFLIDPAGADIDIGIAWPVILSLTLTSALFFCGLLAYVVRARQRKIVSGAEELIGSAGQVVGWSGNEGRVRVHGEVWAARSIQPLEAGTPVVVRERSGLTLLVEPIQKGCPQ